MKFPQCLATSLAASLCLVLFATTSARAAEDSDADTTPAKESTPSPDAVIVDGSTVAIEYTLTTDGGEVSESNVGKEPLTYRQGGGEMLPALEAQLAGMKVGASKKIDLTAEEGYGPVQPELFHSVEPSQIPEEARKAGAVLIAQDAEGQQRPVRVQEVKDDAIVLDLNHPLAGKALHFQIKVLSIE